MRIALLLVFFCPFFAGYSQTATPVKKGNLASPTLNELSGLIHWNGKLYGHEDGGNDPVIFEMDSTTGAITKTITLQVSYTAIDDWEDITQDETYVYIGNFGNNANGSRKDIKLYRIPKASITAVSGSSGTIPAANIDVINFSYENQTRFCPGDFVCTDSANNTTFDCEAVICDNGVLHLFTKDWVSPRTVHYTVPATPGTYIATRKEEFDTQNFLITGATKLNNKVVALLGYNNPRKTLFDAHCAVWLIMGFSNMDNLFSTATKKLKIDIGKMFTWPTQQPTDLGQLESITAVNTTRVIIAGERFAYSQISVDIPPQLFGLNLDVFIPQEMILAEGISNLISRANDNSVTLNWEYVDAGARFFEVQKSVTGEESDFNTIEKINAGNSYPYTYSFSDNNITDHAKIFYRIKVTTLDGRNFFSKILVIKKDNDRGFSLSTYPSPFRDKIAISFSNVVNQQLSINIIDVYGRTVITRQFDAAQGGYNLWLDGLGSLANGVYFLSCKTGGREVVKKILKQ